MTKRRKPIKKSPETHQKNGNRKDYKSPSQLRAAKLKTPNNKIAGRPSQYPSVNKKKIFQYYLLGLTDDEVGALLEPPVDGATLIKWRKEYPEFNDTVVQAKEGADAMVAAAMYSRAVGHKTKATKFFLTREGEIIKQDYIEHYAPDVAAGKFWLTNRQSKLFKERPEEGMGGVLPQTVNVNVITSEDKIKKLLDDNEHAANNQQEERDA